MLKKLYGERNAVLGFNEFVCDVLVNKKYIRMQKCKPVPTLICTAQTLEEPLSSENRSCFRHCIGVARLLVFSRPDPSGRLKHMARYLQGTRDLGIWFPRLGGTTTLECYTDTDWAGDKTDRRSVGCGAIFLGDCLLLEYSRAQSVTGLSSGEVEFYGIASVASEAIFLKSILKFGAVQTQIRIRCDSSAAKSIAQRVGVGRIRHLEVKVLWVQEQVKKKAMVVVKEPGDSNVADLGTKALAAARFEMLRDCFGLKRVPPSAAMIVESKADVKAALASGTAVGVIEMMLTNLVHALRGG